MHRRPEHVTFTMAWWLRQRLEQRGDESGRSLSNLMITHLLVVSD